MEVDLEDLNEKQKEMIKFLMNSTKDDPNKSFGAEFKLDRQKAVGEESYYRDFLELNSMMIIDGGSRVGFWLTANGEEVLKALQSAAAKI